MSTESSASTTSSEGSRRRSLKDVFEEGPQGMGAGEREGTTHEGCEDHDRGDLSRVACIFGGCV